MNNLLFNFETKQCLIFSSSWGNMKCSNFSVNIHLFFRKENSFLSIHLHTNLAINLCILNLIFVNVGCENSFFYLSICWHDRYTYINASYLSPKNYMKRSLMKWIQFFPLLLLVVFFSVIESIILFLVDCG